MEGSFAWRQHWHPFGKRLVEWLDEVVPEGTESVALMPVAVAADTARTLEDIIAEHPAPTGAVWSRTDPSEHPADVSTAAILTAGLVPVPYSQAFFVSVHSRAIAWWLASAWRGRQLAVALDALDDAELTVPSAATARGLLETAAAVWADAIALEQVWRTAKERPRDAGELALLTDAFAVGTVLDQVQFGAKFGRKTADLDQLFSGLQRVNVLNAVDKLARAVDDDQLQVSYAWLSNVVHPSVGTVATFGTWGTADPSGLQRHTVHAERWEHGRDAGNQTIGMAVAGAARTGLAVLTMSLNAALALVDDIGLTTGAPALGTFAYWRNLRPPEDAGAMCPCRSGLPFSACHHSWGDEVPAIPKSFRAPRA